MTVRRELFFITTGENQALQRELATRTRPVPQQDQDLLDIEVFSHTYDPERFRAWLERAADPMVNGASATSQATPADANAGSDFWQWVRGSTRGTAAASGRTAVVGNVIDRQGAAVQTAIFQDQLNSLRRALLSINISPQAMLRLKRLLERVWGYYPYESDQYLDGTASDIIENRYQAGVWGPLHATNWRVIISALWRTQPGVYQFSAAETIFGLEKDYNRDSIGCRVGSDGSGTTPNACQAPTGECHSVWWQQNAALRGGRMYTPAELSNLVHHDVGTFDTFSRIGTDNPRFGWRGILYEPHRPSVGRWRLHVIPPLAWYWSLYFAPQPEFDGLSFVEWLLRQDVRELVRATRRENTLANAAVAGYYGSTIAGLVGQAEVDFIQAQQRAERRRQAVEGMVSGVGAAATTVATAINPIAGFIAGVASTAASIVTRIVTTSDPIVRVDVLGRLFPVFSQFAIFESNTAFNAALERQIGTPPGTTVDQPASPGTFTFLGVALQTTQASNVPPSTKVIGGPLAVTMPQRVDVAPSPPAPQAQPRTGSSGLVIAGVVLAAAAGGTAWWYHAKSKSKRNGRRSR